MIPAGSLTAIESAILAQHPDELNLAAVEHLRNPANAGFLSEYEATWADVIAPRRRTPSPCSPCSSSPSS